MAQAKATVIRGASIFMISDESLSLHFSPLPVGAVRTGWGDRAYFGRGRRGRSCT